MKVTEEYAPTAGRIPLSLYFINARLNRVKPHRIIHLCEVGCVVPAEDSQGQGTVRRFSKDNLFLLAVSLELQNAGVSSLRI